MQSLNPNSKFRFIPFAVLNRSQELEFKAEGMQFLQSQDETVNLSVIGWSGPATSIPALLHHSSKSALETPIQSGIWIANAQLISDSTKEEHTSLFLQLAAKTEAESRVLHAFCCFFCTLIFQNQEFTPSKLDLYDSIKDICPNPNKLASKVYFLRRKPVIKHELQINPIGQGDTEKMRRLKIFLGGESHLIQMVLPPDNLINKEVLSNLRKEMDSSSMLLQAESENRKLLKTGPILAGYAEKLAQGINKKNLVPLDCVRNIEISTSYSAYLSGINLFKATLDRELNNTKRTLPKMNELRQRLSEAHRSALKKYIECEGDSLYFDKLESFMSVRENTLISNINSEHRLKNLKWLQQETQGFQDRIQKANGNPNQIKEVFSELISKYDQCCEGDDKNELIAKIIPIAVSESGAGGNQNEEQLRKLKAENADLARTIIRLNGEHVEEQRRNSSQKCCIIM